MGNPEAWLEGAGQQPCHVAATEAPSSFWLWLIQPGVKLMEKKHSFSKDSLAICTCQVPFSRDWGCRGAQMFRGLRRGSLQSISRPLRWGWTTGTNRKEALVAIIPCPGSLHCPSASPLAYSLRDPSVTSQLTRPRAPDTPVFYPTSCPTPSLHCPCARQWVLTGCPRAQP